MKIHIVQQGDTLWKLAKKYDVDFEQLKAVNNHLSNPDVIMPGMKIKIPTGSVPVKKQMGKKEEPMPIKLQDQLIKEQPIVKEQPIIKEAPITKEAPVVQKEVVIPPAKVIEEKKPPKMEVPIIPQPIPMQPVQQPILTQQQYQQHLHNMNMNFNIYKPVPPAPIPAPPKMPEMKELPKVETPKPVAQPPVLPTKEMPAPPKPVQMPAQKPMPTQQQCYPVTPVMPGCSYPPTMVPPYGMPQPYPVMPQMNPYGYMPQQVPMGGYPPQMPMPGYTIPVYPNPQQAFVQPSNFPVAPPVAGVADGDDLDSDIPPMMPSMQMPQAAWAQPQMPQQYGDLTMTQQPYYHQMMPMAPQQPWGYQANPIYPNPLPQREENEED